MISVTRLYHFSASHRLHVASLSDEENAALYGKCNNPYGHGHDYVLEVTCAGKPDTVSGVIVPIGALDRLVQSRVLRHFAFRNINRDVPEFATLVPTTENIAIVITRILSEYWPEIGRRDVRLLRVHVQETARNGFEVLASRLPNLMAGLETGQMVYA